MLLQRGSGWGSDCLSFYCVFEGCLKDQLFPVSMKLNFCLEGSVISSEHETDFCFPNHYALYTLSKGCDAICFN